MSNVRGSGFGGLPLPRDCSGATWGAAAASRRGPISILQTPEESEAEEGMLGELASLSERRAMGTVQWEQSPPQEAPPACSAIV